MRLDLIGKAIGALRAGRVGDAGAYKAAALTATAYPDVQRKVLRLSEPLPNIDLDALRTLPLETFGRTYSDLMQARGLVPLVLSPDVKVEVASINLVAVRYVLLHDVFHVLLGFDVDLPGELGVWTFVSEQHYNPSFDRAATCARVLYPCVAPHRLHDLRESRHKAKALASRVPCLIAQPIETFWNEPLSALRVRLNVDPA